jgi:hypothetical protein
MDPHDVWKSVYNRKGTVVRSVDFEIGAASGTVVLGGPRLPDQRTAIMEDLGVMQDTNTRSNRALLLKLLPALALIAFVVPSSAFGQATRTWVSGVGDDANPCSRTAPCKTFAGAISKTATGGEINCIDPGGFGAVTITKSLTIDCATTEGGVLAAGQNGIIINAPATARVKLRGLDIFGARQTPSPGQNGIKVLSAARVSIRGNEIYGFGVGVNVNPSSAETRVSLTRNHIHNNGIGVFNAPGTNTITFTNVTMTDNDIEDNDCGASVSTFGSNASTPVAATNCGAANAGAINKPAIMVGFHNNFTDNDGTPGFGISARGGSVFNIGWNTFAGNDAAIRIFDTATVRTYTPATNVISGNAGDAPNATQPLVRPIR